MVRLIAANRVVEARSDFPPSLFNRVADVAREHFQVPIAVVSIVGNDQHFIGAQGLGVHGTPRDQAFCNHTIMSDEVFVVPDARSDPRFANNPLVIGPPHIRFYAGAPLALENHVRIGAVCIIDTQPRNDLNYGQRLVLRNIAEVVTSELQRLLP